MALPLIAGLVAPKMPTPQRRAHATVDPDVEVDCPWTRCRQERHVRAAEPTVWIEEILNDLDRHR